MFHKSAQLYDTIYNFKDYQKEAEEIKSFILKVNEKYHSILNVACGTGNHDQYLKEHFQIDGLDINEDFIEIAKEKNIKGQYFVRDMIQFDLGKKYDVVMCLFSSIGYVQTNENVVRTLFHLKEHLNEHGMILIEPWLTPVRWESGRVDVLNAEGNGMKITRMTHTARKENLSILKFHYLIGNKEGIEHIKEQHTLGLFTENEMRKAFDEVGLKVNYDPVGLSGRGMYTGILSKKEE